MPEVAPFAAVRYDHDQLGGDLSNVVAPPYDVLNQTNKDELLARSDHNIVAIDLPHLPPKSLGPADCYQRSKNLLDAWLADGTLVQESQPALYVYHQEFEHDGQRYTRRMFIARVRLHAFEDRVILPHEQTFGGPKEDRLALMEATRCQLSPVFALYSDPADRIGTAFAESSSRPADVKANLEGVENRLWIVTKPAAIAKVQAHMADNSLYIADGHHRYTTALTYRQKVMQRHGGQLPADHPANYVMLVLASMDDPGCLILPYHRALAGVGISELLAAWSQGTERVPADEADLVIRDGRSGEEIPLRYSARQKLRQLDPDQCDPWYDLDAAYLHRYLIDNLLESALSTKPDVRYVKSAAAAISVATKESGVALLTRATPIAHLRAVSDAGGLMPQKSTYFFPKLATGLTINTLE